jgi:hypothetical protein
VSRNPTPEENWGKDSSSLVLAEQSKALPASIVASNDNVDSAESERDAQSTAKIGKSNTELLQRLTEAERDGKTFLQTYINPARERSHKAFRNEHFAGSKYLSPRYKTRSKLFKPKTRAAVRKAQSAAAGALFASADVVNVEASDNSNPQQRASAELKQELLNYRLERTNGRDSIPWFLVAMGAHQDALLDGICVSKQYWKFRERARPLTPGEDPIRKITVDRPDSLNIQPENVIIDPNCEWTRPAQTSSYLIVRYPMPIHEVMNMMRPTETKPNGAWLEYDLAELMTLAGAPPEDVQAVRDARSGGADGQQTTKGTGAYRVLWVYENFLHIDGEDVHFWSIGNQKMLSQPMFTDEVYPEFFGERPYVIGLGALETHRPLPMAPAESWQQLQQEANDVTNLRLDQMKQVVTPVTKVKRGRQVDLEQVNRRGQDTILMLTDMEDVEFDRPPDVPASAMNESNLLNNDFDELAGVFSNASVQSNRDMNDTVGGMKLLNQGANAITEFDLRVWVETWVEPVLYQLVKLEEYYESDEKILAIAGQKAELIAKYGIDEITDHLLMQDVTLRCSVGIGAADPMQSMEKFGVAANTVNQILAPFVAAGAVNIAPKSDEIINEIFGKAGYKGAFDRFFTATEPQQAPPPDPIKMAEITLKGQIEQAKAELKEREIKLKGAQIQMDGVSKEKDRQLKERIARLEHQFTLIEQAAQHEHQAQQADVDRDFQVATTLHGSHREDQARNADREAALHDRHLDREDAHTDRSFQAATGQEDRQFQRANAQEDRAHKEGLTQRQLNAKRLEGLNQRRHQAQEASAGREFEHAQGERGREHELETKSRDQKFQSTEKKADREFQGREKNADRSHQSRQASAERTHTRNQSAADREHQATEAHRSRKHTSQEADKGREHTTVLAKMTAKQKAAEAKKPEAKKKAGK